MALVRFAKENRVDLTVVGPDDPLAAGIVDLFRSREIARVWSRQIGSADRVVENLRKRIDALAKDSHRGAGDILRQQ